MAWYVRFAQASLLSSFKAPLLSIRAPFLQDTSSSTLTFFCHRADVDRTEEVSMITAR